MHFCVQLHTSCCIIFIRFLNDKPILGCYKLLRMVKGSGVCNCLKVDPSIVGFNCVATDGQTKEPFRVLDWTFFSFFHLMKGPSALGLRWAWGWMLTFQVLVLMWAKSSICFRLLNIQTQFMASQSQCVQVCFTWCIVWLAAIAGDGGIPDELCHGVLLANNIHYTFHTHTCLPYPNGCLKVVSTQL